MPLRRFLGTVFSFLLVVVSWSGCASRNDRFNVIWVTLDALRADHLGCYGYPRPTTPFIDSLAARGVRIDRALSQAPATKAAVAAMFTSLHPTVHKALHHGAQGRVGDVLPAGATTLAERFASAGYLTAGFVSNPHLQEIFGFHQGFEVYRYLSKGPVAKADKVLGATAAWLGGEPRVLEEDFFLYIHLMDTHFPYEPPEAHRRLFVDPGLEGQRAVYRNGEMDEPPTDEEMRYLRGLYDGALHFADDQLRLFFDRAEALGLLENTLIVIVADHGDEFLEHGGLGHGHTLYSELIHVPAILVLPGRLPAGRVVRTPVSMVDIGVSLLTLAGIDWDPGLVSGRDITGLLRGAGDDPSAGPPVLSERGIQRALVDESHKYIFRGPKPGNGEKLFDLRGDRGEQKNLLWDEKGEKQRMIGEANEVLERIRDLDRRLGLKKATAPMPGDTRDQLRALGYIE